MRSILLLLVLLVLSCEGVERPRAKDGIAAPFSMASLANGEGFLLLNSASYGEYEAGSLVELSLRGSGSFEKKGWLETPLLGTKVSFNANSNLVAVAAVGAKGAIRILRRVDAGSFSVFDEIGLGETRMVGTMSWFNLGGLDYLTAEVLPPKSARKVFVWRVGNSVERVLSLPEDLSDITEGDSLSFSSPIYLPNEKLFVVFPDEYKSLFLPLLGADAFLRGSFAESDPDPRKFSLMVIKAENLFGSGEALTTNYALVPTIYRDDGFGGEISKRTAVDYRRFFSTPHLPSGGQCDTDFANSFLVVDETGSSDNDGYGGIYRLSGWSQLKAQHASAFTAIKPSEKVVRGSIAFSAYSAASNSRNLGSAGSRILSISTQATAALCRPFWLRMENRTETRGNGKAWIQWNNDESQRAWPYRFKLPDLGVGSFVVIGDYLVTASYSYNKLRSMPLSEILSAGESDKPD